MTKNEIIGKLAKEKKVEEFVANTAKTSNEDIKDLIQEIYLILLNYNEEKIIEMYEKEELDFFIARLICNQYRSETSPFYTKYKKWSSKRSEFRGQENKTEDNEEYRWMTKKSVPNCSNN